MFAIIIVTLAGLIISLFTIIAGLLCVICDMYKKILGYVKFGEENEKILDRYDIEMCRLENKIEILNLLLAEKNKQLKKLRGDLGE